MKKRLFGLIALVLCLMLAGMPAALADFYVPHGNGAATWIDNDSYLIEGGTLLKADGSGADCTLHYGSPPPSPSDRTVTVPSFTSTVIDSSNPFWHVWLSGYTDLYVESAGTPVMRYPYRTNDENAHVFVFGHPLSGVTARYSDTYYPAENAVNAFQDWATRYAPDASMNMYDAAVYEKKYEGVWASTDQLPSGGHFYLPGVNGTVLAVLHWANNERIEEMNFEVTDNGLLIKGAKEFSPFAVVYTSNTDPELPQPSQPPRSGDSSPLVLLSLLAGASLAGMIWLTSRRKKTA